MRIVHKNGQSLKVRKRKRYGRTVYEVSWYPLGWSWIDSYSMQSTVYSAEAMRRVVRGYFKPCAIVDGGPI